MRAIWKGAVSFGLVHIPVKLYPATEDKDIHFNQLHRVCHSPIKYRKLCPACDREVAPEEIARAYQYLPGQYIPVEDDDLASLPLGTTKTVEILDFVRTEEIDPIYFAKAYYLEPAEGGAKAYALLCRTLTEKNRAAVAKVVLRTKENLALLRVVGERVLTLETMYYPAEIRSYANLENLPEDVALGDREMEIAGALVDQLSVPFQPERYQDRYQEALLAFIEAKASGQGILAAPPSQVPTMDLFAALQESLRLAEVHPH